MIGRGGLNVFSAQITDAEDTNIRFMPVTNLQVSNPLTEKQKTNTINNPVKVVKIYQLYCFLTSKVLADLIKMTNQLKLK